MLRSCRSSSMILLHSPTLVGAKRLFTLFRKQKSQESTLQILYFQLPKKSRIPEFGSLLSLLFTLLQRNSFMIDPKFK